MEVPRAHLTNKFYDYVIYTGGLPNGDYDLRATANCRDSLNEVVYSQVISGRVDRKPIRVFGTPYPNDGILSYNDQILVHFDEGVAI